MHIFIDADACPVVGIVEKIAKKYNLPVTLLCDTNHVLYSEYSEVIVVGEGAEVPDLGLSERGRAFLVSALPVGVEARVRDVVAERGLIRIDGAT